MINNKEKQEKTAALIYLLIFALAALSIALIQPLKDTQGFFNPPDEEARFLVPQYICVHGTIPVGFEEEVQIRGYGGSYAFYTAFPYIVMGFFMRLVSLLTDSPLLLLYAARLVNVAAGVLSAFIVYLLGGLLFSDKRFAWLFRIAVMFLPQHLFLYTYVNNDAFSLLGVVLIWYSFVRMYRGGRSTLLTGTLTLGLGISLCALSYYNSYGYILISVPLFIGLFLKKEEGKISFDLKNLLKYAALETALVLLLTGWWFIRSCIVLDGDILGLDAMSRAQERVSLATGIVGRKPPLADGVSVPQFVADPFIWASLVFSYIGQYGCTSIIANKLFYFAYMLYMFIGFVPGIIMVHKSRGKRLLLEICGIIAAIISFSLWFIYCYTTDLQTQGRYIMMTVTTLMYFIVTGYEMIINKLSKSAPAEGNRSDLEVSAAGDKKATIMVGIILAFILMAFFAYTFLIAYPCYLQFPVWSQM